MPTDAPPVMRDNPLTAGMPATLLPQMCVLVLFGAAGDLSWRKLLPAIYNLNVDGVLPSSFAVLGFGIGSQGDPDEWLRARARDGIEKFSRQPLDEGHWADFARALFYVEGSFNDARASAQLKARLETIAHQFGIPAARVYYLAIPPAAIETSVNHLREAGLIGDPAEPVGFTRVIVEKPIGRDLESARQINAVLARCLAESQTYRIDHYLGTETVQNLLVVRTAHSN